MNTPEHWRTSRQFADWFTNRTTGFIRGLANALILWSLYLLAHAAYDEHRGVAAPPYVPTKYSRPIERLDTHPKAFHHLMSYEWCCPVVFFAGGLIIRGIVRRADRVDPFSPSFGGKAALEECERKLDAELRNYHSPIRD